MPVVKLPFETLQEQLAMNGQSKELHVTVYAQGEFLSCLHLYAPSFSNTIFNYIHQFNPFPALFKLKCPKICG